MLLSLYVFRIMDISRFILQGYYIFRSALILKFRRGCQGDQIKGSARKILPWLHIRNFIGVKRLRPQSNPIIVFGSFADILIRSHLLNFTRLGLKKIRQVTIRRALLIVPSVYTKNIGKLTFPPARMVVFPWRTTVHALLITILHASWKRKCDRGGGVGTSMFKTWTIGFCQVWCSKETILWGLVEIQLKRCGGCA